MTVNNQVTYTSAFKNFLSLAGLGNAKGKKSQLETIEKNGKTYTKIQTPEGDRFISQTKKRGVTRYEICSSIETSDPDTIGLGTKRGLKEYLAQSPDVLKKAFENTVIGSKYIGDCSSGQTVKHYIDRNIAFTAIGKETAAKAELMRMGLNLELDTFFIKDLLEHDDEISTPLLQRIVRLFPKFRYDWGRDPIDVLIGRNPENLDELKARKLDEQYRTTAELYNKYLETDPAKAKEILEAEIAKDKGSRDGSLNAHELYFNLAQLELKLGDKTAAHKALFQSIKANPNMAYARENILKDFLKENFSKTELIAFWNENKAELRKLGWMEKIYELLEQHADYGAAERIELLKESLESAKSFDAVLRIAGELDSLGAKESLIKQAIQKLIPLHRENLSESNPRLAQFYEKHGFIEEAFETLKQAGGTDELVDFAARHGKEQELENLLKTENNLSKLASFYIKTKQFKEALATQMKRFLNSGERTRDFILASMADLLKQLGDTASAARLSEYASETKGLLHEYRGTGD